MDRIQVCGTCDAGSIPAESTEYKKSETMFLTFCILCSRSTTTACRTSGIESPEYVFLARKTTRNGRREIFVTTKIYLSKIPAEHYGDKKLSVSESVLTVPAINSKLKI